MIISHEYKFIFVKTVKTAGTSIEAYLSNVCPEDDIFSSIEPPIKAHRPRNQKGIWNPIPDIFKHSEHYTGNSRGIKRELKDLIKLNKFYNHMPEGLCLEYQKRHGTVIINSV